MELTALPDSLRWIFRVLACPPDMNSLGKIDLNLFVVLEAIFTEGNITQASKSLNLTQPRSVMRSRDCVIC